MKYTQKKLVRWWGEGQRVLELRQIVLAHTEGQEPGSGN